MIHLSAAAAIMLYLGVTLFAVLGMWVYFHLKSKKRKILSSREELYLCEYCHCIYLADPLIPNNQCPECQSYNKNNRYPHKR